MYQILDPIKKSLEELYATITILPEFNWHFSHYERHFNLKSNPNKYWNQTLTITNTMASTNTKKKPYKQPKQRLFDVTMQHCFKTDRKENRNAVNSQFVNKFSMKINHSFRRWCVRFIIIFSLHFSYFANKFNISVCTFFFSLSILFVYFCIRRFTRNTCTIRRTLT